MRTFENLPVPMHKPVAVVIEWRRGPLSPRTLPACCVPCAYMIEVCLCPGMMESPATNSALMGCLVSTMLERSNP